MTDEKVDRLFLRTHCVECGKVRAEMDFGAAVDDDFRGTHGEELRVYTALSAKAAHELLGIFGVDAETPVVLAHDGAVIAKAKNVIMHLRRAGMVSK